MEVGETVIPTIFTVNVTSEDGDPLNDGPATATDRALSVDPASMGFETISRQSSIRVDQGLSVYAINPFKIGIRSRVITTPHLQSKAGDISDEIKIDIALTSAFEEYQMEDLHKLQRQFQAQHGRGADPAQILELAQRLHGVHNDDLWLCFQLVEPAMAFYLEECYREILIIDAMLLSSTEYSTIKLSLDWKRRWMYPMSAMIQKGPSDPRWYYCRARLPVVHTVWQKYTEADKPNIDLCNLDQIRANVAKLVEFLREQDSAMEEAEEAAQLEAEGLSCHDIWISVLTSRIAAKRNENIGGSMHDNNNNSAYGITEGNDKMQLGNPTKTASSWSRRLKNPSRAARRRNRSRTILVVASSRAAVIITVSGLSVAAAVTLGLAVWECGGPDSLPSIDSNFFSTISQASTGIAGLYCIVVPLLRTGQVPVKQEKIFRILLWFSAALSVVSIVIYPWQVQTSMVLSFLASIAQVVATLQLVIYPILLCGLAC